MLDGIEMNVVRAALKVAVVAYGVLPKTSLPKQILSTVITGNIGSGCNDATSKLGLDCFPAAWKI
jgi:hypothetical protein